MLFSHSFLLEHTVGTSQSHFCSKFKEECQPKLALGASESLQFQCLVSDYQTAQSYSKMCGGFLSIACREGSNRNLVFHPTFLALESIQVTPQFVSEIRLALPRLLVRLGSLQTYESCWHPAMLGSLSPDFEWPPRGIWRRQVSNVLEVLFPSACSLFGCPARIRAFHVSLCSCLSDCLCSKYFSCWDPELCQP